ncbi:MAG TPA: alpha/beta fold hydrolase [Lautropia sp.]|nr:alpha/beta fold hydrolase [Lautropia sp.]
MATSIIERIVYGVDDAAGTSGSGGAGGAGRGGGAVLCIHGLGGSSNTWTPLMPALQRHRVIRIDLPGSGRSCDVDGELSIGRFTRACLRVMAACQVERVQVLAHSMGTIVAAHLAAAEPGRVSSMALFGPLFAPPDAARPGLRARASRVRAEGVVGMQAVADTLVQASTSSETRATRPAAVAFVRESLMRQDPAGYARSAEALAEAAPADAARITCPTLLVTGDQDGVAPPQSVRHMGDKIADAQVHVLPGCGHWTPVERPDACMELLRRFQPRRTN